MNITIKKMETEDEIRGKAYVHWRSWHEAYPGIVSQDILDDLTLEKCEQIAFRWPDNLIIAKDEERVIGFVGYGNRDSESPDIGEIFALYVLKDYYGKGVGRLLMEAGLKQLERYPRIIVWALKDNKRAIRFYQKCGFCPDGTEKTNIYVGAQEIRLTLVPAQKPENSRMSFFVEGLQGSGKSTLVEKMSDILSDHVTVREGEYSPVELAWCAYVTEERYREILNKYENIREDIEEKTYQEADRKIICYTKIRTDIPGFYQDLERNEIYNGRISYDDYKSIVLKRYGNWQNDGMIFECSLFQNSIEDMILFRDFSDEQIIEFFKSVSSVLEGKKYHIVYLFSEDIRGNLDVIRKERSDGQGNELWFPLMMKYFDESPFARKRGLKGEEALIEHFAHRQALELRICREIFPDRHSVLEAKKYSEEDIAKLCALQ